MVCMSVCKAGERKLLDRFPQNLEQTYELFQSAYQSRIGGGLKYFENQSHFGPKLIELDFNFVRKLYLAF